jgi:hypothetical protein
MSKAKAPAKHPRQVTVQPQEPEPPQGGPPKQPHPKPERSERVPAGAQDRRSGKQRDGNA